MQKLKGLYILDEGAFRMIYPPDVRGAIAEHIEMIGPAQTRASIQRNLQPLAEVEVVFSGWGAPLFDECFLDAAPKLKAIFYGAGSAGYCITPAVWDRGIVITSAIAANAIPVAEYTMANILLSLKRAWRFARQTRDDRRFPDRNAAPGCYLSTVGLISLGSITRALLKMLAVCDLNVVVYDPYLADSEAQRLRVRRVELDELFRCADVVSLHTPSLTETQGMITGEHFQSMKQNATFINTARPEVVRQDEMIRVARARPDLEFILDVIEPEPPDPSSPLFELANVVITPHIAGSVGQECGRMGQYMVDELRRYVRGEPLLWAVTPELAANSSHRLVQRVAAKHRPLEIAISNLRSVTGRPANAMGGAVEIPLE